MRIVDYNRNYSSDITVLSVECFFDSSFYAAYKENGENGKKDLGKLFVDSMNICLEIGIAKCALIDGKVVGFIMGFDYGYVKRHYPDKFRFFFNDSNFEDQSDILNEDLEFIDRAVKKSDKSAYLMVVAVGKRHRNKGIASKLVETFLYSYIGYDIVTDVVSAEMEYLCKKFGFIRYDAVADGCSIYLKKN